MISNNINCDLQEKGMSEMRMKLSEVSKKISKGSTPRGKVNYSKNEKNFFLRVTDMVDLADVYNSEFTLSDKDINKNKMKLWPINTVLVSIEGTVGKISILKKEMSFNQAVAGIVPNEEIINPRYLMYYLRTTPVFSSILKGTIMPALRLGDLSEIEIEVPDMNIQNKIVSIVDSITNKMDLNNKINNKLYDISKQLLLKYLDENNNSEEINISELLNVFTGKKNANETSTNGKYKFFSCAPESLLSDTYLYDGAAIIVAGNGAYTGRTRFYDGKFELYQRTYGLTLKDGLDKNNIYGLYVFMKTIFEPDKMGGTHGSAIPYIVLSDLTGYKLKYNKDEFDKFSNLVSSNIKMIQKNEKFNEQLSQLRDTLLPKLMNGEIDLDNIEI